MHPIVILLALVCAAFAEDGGRLSRRDSKFRRSSESLMRRNSHLFIGEPWNRYADMVVICNGSRAGGICFFTPREIEEEGKIESQIERCISLPEHPDSEFLKQYGGYQFRSAAAGHGLDCLLYTDFNCHVSVEYFINSTGWTQRPTDEHTYFVRSFMCYIPLAQKTLDLPTSTSQFDVTTTTTPSATTPSATTPSATTPSATTPSATTPSATSPSNTPSSSPCNAEYILSSALASDSDTSSYTFAPSLFSEYGLTTFTTATTTTPTT